MKKLPSYFIKGLLSFIPIAFTIYILIFVFSKTDGLLRNFFNIKIPGLGIIIAVLLLTGIGFLSTNIFAKAVINFVDMIFRNVPFVKLVYNSIGDLINAFVDKKKGFKEPAIVTIYPNSGGKVLGFIITDDLSHFGLQNHVVVYVPQSYNFAGQTLIFPKENVVPIKNVPSSEVMTFIVSAGIAGRHDVLGQ